MCYFMADILGEGIIKAGNEKWYNQRKVVSKLFTMRALKDYDAYHSASIGRSRAFLSWSSRDE
ncbi:hypothetical protein CCR75_002159 [Bremia lactucae]|uniref:Cytochrome P450 n=1 Tax=Bremia lactucae TaxID=4779 RepID=A0A976FHA7_BRELC|nr:hypothetical protein CCR75_002159 [Bremia lactucae]